MQKASIMTQNRPFILIAVLVALLSGLHFSPQGCPACLPLTKSLEESRISPKNDATLEP